jgi:hypothetical protein
MVDEQINDGGHWTTITFAKIDSIEEQDTDEAVFLRRMGIRKYLKELRMNMINIVQSKANNTNSDTPKPKKGKKAKKGKGKK